MCSPEGAKVENRFSTFDFVPCATVSAKGMVTTMLKNILVVDDNEINRKNTA